MNDRTARVSLFEAESYHDISDADHHALHSQLKTETPITAINQEIRRKHVAAAAAVASPLMHHQTMLSLSLQDYTTSDPWDSLSSPEIDPLAAVENSGHQYAMCLCRWTTRKRANSRLSPQKSSSSSSGMSTPDTPRERGGMAAAAANTAEAQVICPTCGKKPPIASSSGFAWSKQRSYMRMHRRASFVNGAGDPPSSAHDSFLLKDPQHAQALLRATPQLRFLSPASTDMQGTGHTAPRNILSILAQFPQMKLGEAVGMEGISTTHGGGANASHAGSGPMGGMSEYQASLVRDQANQQAASELASLLWVLAHEMSLEEYGTVESSVLSSVFALVHSPDKDRRMAGLAALDALLAAPSADEEKKAIKFANTLSTALRSAHGDFEFLSAVSKALGHMATRTANVDFVESEVTRALEWLSTERSDRRLAACLVLKEFAIHATTTFHSKTSQSSLGRSGSNEFLDHIFEAIRDPQPIVRTTAADALSRCLKILVGRRHVSLTALLCQVHFSVMEGLKPDTSKKRQWNAIATAEASQHGSLLVVGTMLAYTADFMLPRFEEVCRAVLGFTEHPKALIRLEVVRLIPRLARRGPMVFGRRYLDHSLQFLLESAALPLAPRVGVDIRPSAYAAIGQMILALTDDATGQVVGGSDLPTVRISDDPSGPGSGYIVELRQRGIVFEKVGEIFALVRKGLRHDEPSSKLAEASTLSPALHCAASLVEALGELALPYISDLIDDMFRSGLSNDLIRCLNSIAQCVPERQSEIEDRMLQEVSVCLAGTRDVYDPLASFRTSVLRGQGARRLHGAPSVSRAEPVAAVREPVMEASPNLPLIVTNMSADYDSVRSLVLSLETLASFGGVLGRVTTSGAVVPLLPFVQDVAAQYLSHPSAEVRRAAALTCCALLIPHGEQRSQVASYSGVLVEDVLERLLRVSVSDPSAVVRLCVVRALDSRYDTFLAQTHHLQELFLLLHDEALATRAAGLQLLGRLAAINPASILPVLRRFLNELIVELECGVDTGRGREEATRLMVFFLRAKPLQRLIHPVLPSLINALPLDGAAPPRLASASLEALGELAQATGTDLQPWVKEVIPHVLATMQDQSSASKQRTSLRTLGQIAGSTGYVVLPYLDYPKLLGQATDVLPATKRAPWSLRREVIRTLGILGALDPDRYHAVASKTRKGGANGGAYFEEMDLHDVEEDKSSSDLVKRSAIQLASSSLNQPTTVQDGRKRAGSELPVHPGDADDDQPAYLFMYEQYAMVAQPVSTLPPAKRMTPVDDDFYPRVAIQALMRIFKDPALAVHHGMVIQAVMFIFKSLLLRCVPYLPKVVPHMIHAVRTCGPSGLRESLLQQLSSLSMIVREHLRPYVADVLDVVEQFWSSRHLSTILSLISNIAVGVPDEFHQFVPRLIRRLLSTFDELQIADWSTEGPVPVLGRGRLESEKLRLILSSVSSLKEVLGGYLHVLVPALLKLADALAVLSFSSVVDLPESVLIELSVLVFRTIASLLESQSGSSSGMPSPYVGFEQRPSQQSESGLPSRVVQPLVRLLRENPPKSPAVGMAIIDALCVAAKQIGGARWAQLYDEVVRSAVSNWRWRFVPVVGGDSSPLDEVQDDGYLACLKHYMDFVEDLQQPRKVRPRAPSVFKGSSFASSVPYQSTADMSMVGTGNENPAEGYEQSSNPPLHKMNTSKRQKVNQANLSRAWDVSQRSSRDDWEEWMRRLAIHLLREAPSPALRATASLAPAYQPLARELFNAAFACCWKELTETYRQNLVDALVTAFSSDVSPEILQALLNLAEFMEHDPSGGLPIEIPILAQLALKCRAYAKALHYKEREFSMTGSHSCVESLISINRKLDLQDAALGVLKVSSLGEALTNDIPMGDELSTKFSRHYMQEMFYSVIWSTDDRAATENEPVDLSATEELWLAKLGSWNEALAVYEDKLRRDPHDFEAMLGCMRCRAASGDWRKVLDLAEDNWVAELNEQPPVIVTPQPNLSARSQRKALRLCAQAAWRLGQWDELEKFSSQLSDGSYKEQPSTPTPTSGCGGEEKRFPTIDFDGAFYTSILHIHRKEWARAADAIDAARRAMDGRMTALMAESYNRAYPSMVTAQTLAEMEEIVELRKLEERSKVVANRHPANRPNENRARERLLAVWKDRLAGCRVDAEVHASILAVRSLVLGPGDEVESTLTLAELSRQAQRYKFAARVLMEPLEGLGARLDGSRFGKGSESWDLKPGAFSMGEPQSSVIGRIVAGDIGAILPLYQQRHEDKSRSLVTAAGGLSQLTIQYRLYFAYVKHLWYADRKDEAIARLESLSDVVDMVYHCERVEDTSLRVACWVELGDWKIAQAVSPSSLLQESLQIEILTAFKRATLLPNCGYKAWHSWALLNFRLALQMRQLDEPTASPALAGLAERALRNHVVAAVDGFVNAISVGSRKWSASVQQDLLNLLTCLFKYGNVLDVAQVFNHCIDMVATEAWLGVLPQLLARIYIKDLSIRSVLHPLLSRLGEKHPQALMYPLSVLLKSPVVERKNSAESLMNTLKARSSELVEQALMVSSELIRVAILWLETWHEGLEDASRLYFGEGNVSGMLDLLLPLHQKLEEGAETRRESDFLKSFGQDLAQAHHHIKEYIRLVTEVGSNIPTGPGTTLTLEGPGRQARQNEEAETAMNRAWDIYYTVFRRINKQLPSLTKLELTKCSPALSRARSLELGVPGSYRVDGSYIKIEKFVPSVEVITSKQRPRKITLRGSDGKDYVFLLKGHEDLRQDERVMQLFGLVNALLIRDPQTKKHDLQIKRYAISPLSHNCGVVGWVPHCDTMHSLIRDYRQSKKIPLNMENREMIKIAPDYELLTVMQKVEGFTEALKKTTGRGNDLYEILWLKSTNSEEWLERRTKYTRSLAVMSMVGYILGLGDRHPSNLMLDKLSGRVLHIDFGDCFEVAMNREKFPEKVPFRLTRMLVKAMEVSGIEGSYRSTCERTMTVLRDSRDSLVAMLEAFVYDPLISWRLADLSPGGRSSNVTANPGRMSEMLARSEDGAPVGGGGSAIMDHMLSGPNGVNAILEEGDDDDDDDDDEEETDDEHGEQPGNLPSYGTGPRRVGSIAASRARSLQMYSSIQSMAANLNDSRIASITGGDRSDPEAPNTTNTTEGSLARSRLERSIRQREVISMLGGEDRAAHEEALNEKALKVIRRVQDKLTGTDYPDCDGDPLDVMDQVQRLIVQATSSENLCQLFIGWCSFW